MPVIKSAIKKLRKDIKRTKANDEFRRVLDRTLNAAKKSPSAKSVSEAVSQIDRAVKKNLMHKNRAARIKSSLSKLTKPAVKTVQKTAEKVSKTVQTATKKSTKAAKK